MVGGSKRKNTKDFGHHKVMWQWREIMIGSIVDVCLKRFYSNGRSRGIACRPQSLIDFCLRVHTGQHGHHR